MASTNHFHGITSDIISHTIISEFARTTLVSSPIPEPPFPDPGHQPCTKRNEKANINKIGKKKTVEASSFLSPSLHVPFNPPPHSNRANPPPHPPRVAIGRPADPNHEPHPSQTQTEAQNYKLHSLALPELIQIHPEKGKRPKRYDNLSGEDKSK